MHSSLLMGWLIDYHSNTDSRYKTTLNFFAMVCASFYSINFDLAWIFLSFNMQFYMFFRNMRMNSSSITSDYYFGLQHFIFKLQFATYLFRNNFWLNSKKKESKKARKELLIEKGTFELKQERSDGKHAINDCILRGHKNIILLFACRFQIEKTILHVHWPKSFH